MKIRTGFVSNSSSSSFILKKDNLSKQQINAIKNHINYYNNCFVNREHYTITERDEWNIKIKKHTIIGDTWMNNFDMEEFFELLKINEEDYEFHTS